MNYVLETRNLVKKFGKFLAVNDVSFTVGNEIFGMLGPNGAGKTTIITMLITLIKPTSGTIKISGVDAVKHPSIVRTKIGYVSQDVAVDDYLTGRENLLLQGKLYGINNSELETRINEILKIVDLEKRADDSVSKYSGGMKKRLDIATGLLHYPKVLFVDEPTLGLDIQTRKRIWNFLLKLKKEYGITIFLTTHYLEEADFLCDRIAIIDEGKIKTINSPEYLKNQFGGDSITIHVNSNIIDNLVKTLTPIKEISEIKKFDDKITLFVSNAKILLPKLFKIIYDKKFKINSISSSECTLDDVFLSYTGKNLRDEERSNSQSPKNSKRGFRR